MCYVRERINGLPELTACILVTIYLTTQYLHTTPIRRTGVWDGNRTQHFLHAMRECQPLNYNTQCLSATVDHAHVIQLIFKDLCHDHSKTTIHSVYRFSSVRNIT